MSESEQLVAKYIPLSFIKDKSEIDFQIKNTLIFKRIIEQTQKSTVLGDLLEKTQYGYTAKASKAGICKYVRITDLKSGKVVWDQVPYCDCECIDKYELKKNDILIARTGGTTGKSYIVSEKNFPSVFASYLIRLTPKPNILPQYIHSFLNSYYFWNQIIELKSGAAQPNVNAEKMKEIKIPVCPTELQKIIWGKSSLNSQVISDIKKLQSDVFNSTDKIEVVSDELTRQQTLLKKLRQSILQDAISGKLTEQWRKENPNVEPASELLNRIKEEKNRLVKEKKIPKQKPLPQISDDEIPFELPKGWVWARLGEVGLINPRNRVDDNSDVSFIPMNLISNLYGKVPKFEIRKWGRVKSNFTHFRNSDVAVAKITPCFENSKSAIFLNLKNEYGAGTTELHIFRSISSELLPDFIYLIFKTSRFLKDGEKSMSGECGQKRVPTKFVTDYVIPIPSFIEQKLIVTKVNNFFSVCDQLESQITQSQQDSGLLMQAVLKEAFERQSYKLTSKGICIY